MKSKIVSNNCRKEQENRQLDDQFQARLEQVIRRIFYKDKNPMSDFNKVKI